MNVARTDQPLKTKELSSFEAFGYVNPAGSAETSGLVLGSSCTVIQCISGLILGWGP